MLTDLIPCSRVLVNVNNVEGTLFNITGVKDVVICVQHDDGQPEVFVSMWMQSILDSDCLRKAMSWSCLYTGYWSYMLLKGLFLMEKKSKSTLLWLRKLSGLRSLQACLNRHFLFMTLLPACCSLTQYNLLLIPTFFCLAVIPSLANSHILFANKLGWTCLSLTSLQTALSMASPLSSRWRVLTVRAISPPWLRQSSLLLEPPLQIFSISFLCHAIFLCFVK